MKPKMFKEDLEILILLLLPSTCWECRLATSPSLQIRDFKCAASPLVSPYSLVCRCCFTQVSILSFFSVDQLWKLMWPTHYISNSIIHSLGFTCFLILSVELTPALQFCFSLIKIPSFFPLINVLMSDSSLFSWSTLCHVKTSFNF